MRPRPAEATPTPADDGTDAPPPARRDETGEKERPIIRKRPSFARPPSVAPPRPESASAPDVLDPARQGGPDESRQIADDRESPGLRPRAETPPAEPEPTGGDAPSLDGRIAWFLEAEDAREFSDRVLGPLRTAAANLVEDIPALATSGRLGARNLVVLSNDFHYLMEEFLDPEVEEALKKAYATLDAVLLYEACEAEL